ncbi:hypothetical protein BC351_00970 [Paenibacillus ferrarius]|uniref:Uncharacterized protein n=1 Tax=Paenibacillus ferrarius TaxID=1469647 RepID=A0A1V4HSC7_9BACL|nr:hypothetical protein [Paenibacillus ferrarius]OPH61844.1 hypothetical protein BC351_00970 [Paenibacillus ferrarius]
MKFSRKATSDDFEKETQKWVLQLSLETREALRNGDHGTRYRIKKEFQCSIQEAAVIQKDYLAYWSALKDFSEGKEVFVEY